MTPSCYYVVALGFFQGCKHYATYAEAAAAAESRARITRQPWTVRAIVYYPDRRPADR